MCDEWGGNNLFYSSCAGKEIVFPVILLCEQNGRGGILYNLNEWSLGNRAK